jgi:hypothetical protein
MLHHTSAHCTCKIPAVRQVLQEVQLSFYRTVFPLKILKTSYGVMRLTTENEQFEHLNKAEVQAKPVTKFIDP